MSTVFLVLACTMATPVPGTVSRPYSPPVHLGVDIGAEAGTLVEAVASGRVHFSGTVAGNRAVSIGSPEDLLLTYSYLSVSTVRHGDHVAAGQVIGLSGFSHGAAGLHLSARVRGSYVDPAAWLRCSRGAAGSLRLLAPRAWAYPPTRAPRPARRNLRPTPSGSSRAG